MYSFILKDITSFYWRDFFGSASFSSVWLDLLFNPLSWFFIWLLVIYPFMQVLCGGQGAVDILTRLHSILHHVYYTVGITFSPAFKTWCWYSPCKSRPLVHLYTMCRNAEMSKPRTHAVQHLTSRVLLALVIRLPESVYRGPSAWDYLHSLHTTFRPGS